MRKVAEELKKGSKPILVLLCGMPGTRKSSTAVKLGALLGFASVVGMDEVRDIMRVYDDDPLVHTKSHEAWKLYGPLNDETFSRGFMAHCAALQRGAQAIITKNMGLGENTIVEGVHLLPSLYKTCAPDAHVVHVLLCSKPGADHARLLKEKFARRHGKQKAWDADKVQHIEKIQKILLDEAVRAGVAMVTSTTPEENALKIAELVVNDHAGSDLNSHTAGGQRADRRAKAVAL